MFTFSGCSLVDFFSAESLLRAPKLTGENSALQSAVEGAVGSEIGLFTPIAGDYRASYILFDANNDGNDEAVVFYSLNSNASVVHMHLLAKTDNEWHSVADITGSGTEVYKVDFFNIDNSQNLEIAVTWSLDDSKREKTLSIYRISSLEAGAENALTSIASIQLADYIYLDIDSDAVNELLYFYYSSTDEVYSLVARVLEYTEKESNFSPSSEINLSQPTSAFVDINFEKDNNNYKIYLDCLSPDNKYFTELILFDYENSALSLPMINNQYISVLSRRAINVTCDDFNKDGKLDIPCELNYEESYISGLSEDNPVSMKFVRWCNYSQNEFTEIGKFFINEFDGFIMNIGSLYESYYFVYDYVNNVTQVRLKNFDEENNVIFSVSCREESDLLNPLLSDDRKNEYDIVISAKGVSMNITYEYVRNLIEDI